MALSTTSVNKYVLVLYVLVDQTLLLLSSALVSSVSKIILKGGEGYVCIRREPPWVWFSKPPPPPSRRGVWGPSARKCLNYK